MKRARYYVRREGGTAPVVETVDLTRAKEFARRWACASGARHVVVDREPPAMYSYDYTTGVAEFVPTECEVYRAEPPRTEGIPLPAPYNRPDPVLKAQARNVWFDRFISGEDV